MKIKQVILETSRPIMETYRNLFTREEKLPYVDEVWGVLARSYADIGGIKGTGFRTPEDMIQNIPFWKINTKDGKVVAVQMYKDKHGRKLVASGTDGSTGGLKSHTNSTLEAHGREYGEKSGKALGHAIKTLGADAKDTLMTVDEVRKVMGSKRIIPVQEFMDGSDLNDDDQFAYNKFSDFKEFFYMRKIGGEWHMKAAFGTPGNEL